jgi:predicted Zn-dependent protease
MTPHLRRNSTGLAIAAVLLSASVQAQTAIEPRKNSYTPAQDVQLGREAAADVRRQLPLLKDATAATLVERIGDRLVEQIPGELRQPAFRYSFEIVNLREINAFALPGGPMFLNRGMIEAARSDAEVAGVMAHELSHVILRHGTLQASKGQKFQIGAIAGQVLGAIVGGRKGEVIAQGSQLGLGTWFLKYGREYEREADLLGAQIMARAGYDPRQMANMFRTIQQQGGSRGPEWLSSHPDPGNRYADINREAGMLQVRGRADTAGAFEAARARLARLPAAPSAEQVARTEQGRQGQGGPAASETRAGRAEPPSGQWRTYRPGDFLRVSVPANWRQVESGDVITYAPAGGYLRAESGQSAFTHGVQIGVADAGGASLREATEQLVRSFAQGNPRLRRQGGYSRTTVGGRQGLTTTLTNVSEVTGETEAVNLSTVQLRDGRLLFLVGVAPAGEARAYAGTFDRVRQSLQIAGGA